MRINQLKQQEGQTSGEIATTEVEEEELEELEEEEEEEGEGADAGVGRGGELSWQGT